MDLYQAQAPEAAAAGAICKPSQTILGDDNNVITKMTHMAGRRLVFDRIFIFGSINNFLETKSEVDSYAFSDSVQTLIPFFVLHESGDLSSVDDTAMEIGVLEVAPLFLVDGAPGIIGRI